MSREALLRVRQLMFLGGFAHGNFTRHTFLFLGLPSSIVPRSQQPQHYFNINGARDKALFVKTTAGFHADSSVLRRRRITAYGHSALMTGKSCAMASAVPVVLLLSAALFAATVADDDCKSYWTSNGMYKPPIDCNYMQFCCGTCNDRRCCYNPLEKLSEDAQDDCFFYTGNSDVMPLVVGVTVAGIVGFIILFTICCVCPCCCLYKTCRKPRPIMTTATTTVITSQYPQQPVIQGGQYPPYQPMPPQQGYGGQPAYGGQPMPTGPYQGQPYAVGPPPPYQEAGGPGYPVPYSQAAFAPGQASYPIHPPVQPGFTQPPPPTDYNSTQPAYNPAYMPPPKTGY
nr:protein shisa-5-like isoform X2 [Misgurnus anguillicaudatus]